MSNNANGDDEVEHDDNEDEAPVAPPP